MDKLDLNNRDILGGNVEKIATLFPGVVMEAQDEATGELRKVVDFDLLRQHLSDELVEGDRERFRLDWPGKKASILKANTPIHKTLRPVREDSEDFDTTENVFIEGDNFEVLKVLQESYLGKVKMIYIDPPYNTGKDFIYRDNFTQDREDYEEEIGVRDDENGGKLVKNTETNGRYHSDWLGMMQERLIVARDLMADDGAIFISIGDDEQANLKKLCDEVFDNENFIAMPIRKKNRLVMKGDKTFKSIVEPVLIYSRDKQSVEFSYTKEKEVDSDFSVVSNGYSEKTIVFKPGQLRFRDTQGLARAGTYGNITLENDADIVDGKNVGQVGIKGPFKWSQEKIYEKLNENAYILIKNLKSMSMRIHFVGKNAKPLDLIDEKYGKVTNEDGIEGLKALGLEKYFDYPKPVDLVKFLTNIINDSSAIVLDFFSGSGTTAHAVMQLNAEDDGNRKHIQVQLAEPTAEDSEAYKAGYKSIPEISRERIRRAGKKIREDYTEQIAKRDAPLDTGFRAYKLSSSNFKDTAKHPDQIDQTSLLADTDSIKTDRTADDLLTEVILSLGLTLDLPIETRDIAGCTVYFVGGNSLVACFDDTLSLDIVDDIAAEKPLRVVFKDSSFASDETRINIDIRLKQLSPETTVQVV